MRILEMRAAHFVPEGLEDRPLEGKKAQWFQSMSSYKGGKWQFGKWPPAGRGGCGRHTGGRLSTCPAKVWQVLQTMFQVGGQLKKCLLQKK